MFYSKFHTTAGVASFRTYESIIPAQFWCILFKKYILIAGWFWLLLNLTCNRLFLSPYMRREKVNHRGLNQKSSILKILRSKFRGNWIQKHKSKIIFYLLYIFIIIIIIIFFSIYFLLSPYDPSPLFCYLYFE